MQVLLVEDDLPLGSALHDSLALAGFRSVWVRRLAEARAHAFAAGDESAAIVLDVNLPDGEGFQLLQEIRSSRLTIPVLVITARDTLEDRLRGLKGGADDYIVKPFAVAELLARLNAVLRRSAGFATDVWQVGELRIDIARREVNQAGTDVALTAREFDLLLELARSVGRVVTRETLLQRVWGCAADVSETALEFQVHTLRKKLRSHHCIHTVRGVGYFLSP